MRELKERLLPRAFPIYRYFYVIALTHDQNYNLTTSINVIILIVSTTCTTTLIMPLQKHLTKLNVYIFPFETVVIFTKSTFSS